MEASFRGLFALNTAERYREWAADTRRQGAKERREARAKAWEDAAKAWLEAVSAYVDLQVAEREKIDAYEAQAQAEEALVRAEEARAARVRAVRERAARERVARTAPLLRKVAAAYEAQAQAWDAQADYEFVEYDGSNSTSKSNASEARRDARWARDPGFFDSIVRPSVSEAHLHALRARENASDMRVNVQYSTGGAKELANKAARAWIAAAQAWEAVSE